MKASVISGPTMRQVNKMCERLNGCQSSVCILKRMKARRKVFQFENAHPVHKK